MFNFFESHKNSSYITVNYYYPNIYLEDLEVTGRVETIQRQHCWGRPEYWDQSWRFEETCCHSNSSEKPSANTDVKNSRGVNNNNNYLDLARELKSLRNMNVTIIPIVIGAFGTVTTGLLKSLGDLEVCSRVETIQTTALLKTARILRSVLETWGDFLSLNLQWKTISIRWCENFNE